MSQLPWAGFNKLRPGRIHLFCQRCKRKMSNTERGEYDPPHATLVVSFCQRCGQGGKDACETFYTASGREIGFEEMELHMAKLVRSR